ncbi:hypothetical protein G4B88_013643 [Cannabis sativa]|uniref:RNase H type-1 domain-containing protein n=1 Tax=Cannabis sativa TaxID=3483 RepID=A0A7J6HTC2_CANSA|nr:hypothetical protein G4B88_013643 [Cannabis sativa]
MVGFIIGFGPLAGGDECGIFEDEYFTKCTVLRKQPIQETKLEGLGDNLNLDGFIPSDAAVLLMSDASWQNGVTGNATNGGFSPRVAYKSIIKLKLGDKDPIRRRIQNFKISKRMKLFPWKLERDILLFRERLQRIFGNDVSCSICGDLEDWVEHLLLQLVEWVLKPDFLKARNRNELEAFRRFGIFVYVLSSGLQESRPIMIGFDRLLWWFLIELGPWSMILPWHGILSQLLGDHVVFIDAANKGLCSAAGIVITNSEGMVVEAFSAHCQTLVLEINSRKASDWKLTTVFRHVLMGLDHLPESTITWIPRSRNEMAHRLSKLAFNFSLFGFLNVKELAPLVSN